MADHHMAHMRYFCTLAVAVALALQAGTPAAAQSAATLKVATTPIDVGAEVLWAKDMGFFKRAGLEVDVSLINNGAAVAAAVAGGAVDIAQANMVTLATAHERGLPFVLVAPGALYSSAAPTTQLAVAKNSPLRGAKDLTGKVVAVSGIKNITQVAAQEWLSQNGVDPAAVNWIELPFPQMAPALAAGRVAAAVIAEPDLSEALAGGARVLAPVYDAVGKQFLIGAWFTTGPWAKAHPELVKRFNEAILETARWANAHRDESARILSKYTKVPIAPGLRRATFAERFSAADAQPLIDAAAHTGVLRRAFPAADFIAAGL